MIKLLLKRLLPLSIRQKIRKKQHSYQLFLLTYIAKSRWLSGWYYLLFNTNFGREQQSVLQGRIQHQTALQQIGYSSAALRRNIHRLEKGLLMQPRKQLFAEAYIQETVHCYQRCVDKEPFDQQELKWAKDVLNQYFTVVGASSIIDQAKSLFLEQHDLQRIKKEDYVPYGQEERVQADISAMSLMQLFQQRRATRWFQQKLVPITLIEQAITMSVQAPSACNRQPFQFYVTTQANTASKLAQHAMGTAGFAHNLPALIIVIGDLSAYPYERDRHVIYIDAGLAAMQLMLALESLGLSSCPINWPDIEEREQQLAANLNLTLYQRPVMLIAVGYADIEGKIAYSQKKSLESVIQRID